MNNNKGILQEAQRGGRKVQMDFYQSFYKPVYNSCYRILRTKEDAEDITQDLFIQVFDKKTTIPNDINTEAWLRRVGINKSIDFLRRKQRITSTDEWQSEIKDEGSEDNYDSYDARKLYDGINKLPKQFQLVLTLYIIEGYDHSEISEILDISNSTSRSQLSRAKDKLRTLLNQKSL